MNAVGIDVSRGKSTVAIRNPFGKILYQPFEITHSSEDLYGLAKLIMSLDGESKVVLENTGVYSYSVAEANCLRQVLSPTLFVCQSVLNTLMIL